MVGLFLSKGSSSQDDEIFRDDGEVAPTQDTSETDTSSNTKVVVDDGGNPF